MKLTEETKDAIVDAVFIFVMVAVIVSFGILPISIVLLRKSSILS